MPGRSEPRKPAGSRGRGAASPAGGGVVNALPGLLAPFAPVPAPTELRQYQADAVAMVYREVRAGRRRIVLQLPTGCHAAGTLILMADGSIKTVESIVVGDEVMGPDSRPRRVSALHRGTDEMFEIVPIKGDSFRVNAGHILTLIRTNEGGPYPSQQGGVIVDISLRDYLAASQTFRHLHKLFRVGVDFPPSAAPPIDPYILGILLGDGSLIGGAVSVTTPDAEIVDSMFAFAERWGLSVRTDQLQGNEANTYSFSTPRGQSNPLLDALRQVGVQGCRSTAKFVPVEYKRGSRETRLEMLAGLIDTDGSLSKCGFDYVSASQRLAEDVAFLARSVGLRACMAVKTVDGTPYWRLYISGDTWTIPTRVVRKRAPDRLQKKDVLRTGFTVRALGEGDYFGFDVDGDHRYLMGDFTVTHNSGKTRIAAAICADALGRDRRAAFTVPMLSLVNQTVERFRSEGIADIGVMQADHELTDWRAPMQVISLQTLARPNRQKLILKDPPRVMLVDECHIRNRALQRLLRLQEFADVIVVGLSATPWSKGMGEDWECLLAPVTMADLIREKWLTGYRIFAPYRPDLSAVKTRAGDYAEEQLAEVMGDGKLVADIVETWKALGENRPTLCFAVDRAHARKIEREFLAAGVATEYADAFTPPEERDAIGERLRTGQTKIVTNVGVLTTGVDWPWVSCLIMARPTKSPALFVQQVGRALRPYGEGKVALILDHASNALNLGFPADIHFDSLDGGEAGAATPRQVKPERRPKECPNCKRLRPAGVFECPSCGAKPERVSKIQCEDGELREVDGSRKAGVSQAERQRFYSELLGYAQQRGKKPGWAAHSYRERFGEFPRGVLPHPIEPTPETRGWVQHRNIRNAKRAAKAKGRAA